MPYKEPKKLNRPLTTKEIIDKIGKKDRTDGSCTSVALAYIGNVAGYDVNDFKGGVSQEIFAERNTMLGILSMPSVGGDIVYSKKDFEAVNELLNRMVEGKEYIMFAGIHTSIVRMENGNKEFLYLQGTKEENGYRPINFENIKDTFGCKNDRTKQFSNGIVEVEKLVNNNEFISLLGYINN